MLNYVVWDKQSSINGVDAEHYLNLHREFADDEVILIENDYGQITNVESLRTLKAIMGLSPGSSADEVAQEFISYLGENRAINTDGGVTPMQMSAQSDSQQTNANQYNEILARLDQMAADIAELKNN